MPERDGYQNGTPSWVDLGALDIPAMTEFYDMVFGWTMAPAGPPELTGGYGMFTQNGKVVAGIGPHRDPTTTPGWSTYIAVDDCDKTVELAKGAGATVVVEPMDVMTAGRMAFLADPQGAVFGLWQAGDHKGAQLVNEPGRCAGTRSSPPTWTRRWRSTGRCSGGTPPRSTPAPPPKGLRTRC